MAAILNFCQKWQNTKLLLSPEPTGYLSYYYTHILYSHIIPTVSNHCSTLTIGGRVISSKFSISRVSKQYNRPITSENNFDLLKISAILNFGNFTKNAQAKYFGEEKHTTTYPFPGIPAAVQQMSS